MNIVIIEDELLTAEDLSAIVQEVSPQANVVAILQSVAEAIRYFKSAPKPDLIFSDIQLGDGLSFDIFSEVTIDTPIIFCTAFDEYAIRAFNTNGIHYLLKPFNAQKVREAMDKYQTLKQTFSNWPESIEKIIASLSIQNKMDQKKAATVLVYFKDSVIPIKLKDIALFYVQNNATYLFTFDNKKYVIDQSLNDLEQLDTNLFYRASRQFLINRHAVKKASSYLSRKITVELNVPFDEVITISKEKVTSFLDWLQAGE